MLEDNKWGINEIENSENNVKTRFTLQCLSVTN